ncbi:acyltransferase [Candidatus Pacearchaeota archaeon]|nr:acyltransferase [Candidatus Pacearchaeota archaeon]
MQKERLIYIDNLRLFLIILVILLHISIIYGGAGNYPIKETASDSISPIMLTFFNAICQSFFMSLFFLLSGYFIPSSYDRNGPKKFVKSRLIRLGIPLIIYTTLFKVILDYLMINFYEKTPLAFSQVIVNNLKNPGWVVGPLWFVEALLIFTFVYVLYRIFINKKIILFNNKFPSAKSIILIIPALAILTFIVRIFIPVGEEIHVFQLGHFVPYIFYFWIGIVSYRNNWLNTLSNNQSKFWKILAIIIIISLPFLLLLNSNTESFIGGFSPESFLFSLWESIACVSIMISLASIFKNRLDKQGKLLAWAAPNFYTAYIIHALVIIPIALIFMPIKFPTYVKFFIVSLIALPLCFIISSLIRKIPHAKRVLG